MIYVFVSCVCISLALSLGTITSWLDSTLARAMQALFPLPR